jgi:hypothetical protein
LEGFYCEDCDNIMGIVEWMKHNPKHSGRHIIWVFLSNRKVEQEIEAKEVQEVLDGQETEDTEAIVSEGKPK